MTTETTQEWLERFQGLAAEKGLQVRALLGLIEDLRRALAAEKKMWAITRHRCPQVGRAVEALVQAGERAEEAEGTGSDG